MTFQITKPGIFTDVSAVDYHADPCPTPSLSQSIAKILIDQSPLHAWTAHPRLNPDYQHDNDTKFDVGNVAHKLMIGRGKEIVVLDDNFDDWRTKEAKVRREAASYEGKIAVLGKTFQRASNMVEAARKQLNLRGYGQAFTRGDGEVVLAWREGDIWMRQLVDWLTPDRIEFFDYKTTDMSVAPHGLGRMMVNAGWPIQAAMADRGLRALLPKAPRSYDFVVQETSRPYALNVVSISADVLAMGAKQLDHAVQLWTRCQRENIWPSYPLETVIPEYPGWAESAWLEREVKEAARERHPSELIMAG